MIQIALEFASSIYYITDNVLKVKIVSSTVGYLFGVIYPYIDR